MIDLAVNQLTERLRTLPFLDLVGGVARQQKLVVSGVTKTLPAMPDPENGDRYTLLSPDQKRAGIAYFEVLNNRTLGESSGGRAFEFSAVVRLVVWLNTKRLAPSNVAPQAMAMAVSALVGKHADVSPLVNISVVPLQEVPRSAEVFGRYTYDEGENQYLMLPFDYFAFDFSLQFAMVANCPVLNIVRTSEQC